MLEDMANNLTESSIVIDVGANIGNHSLYLASVTGCKVIAFEPNESLCKALKESIKVNNLTQSVTVHSVGVYSETGFAKFKTYDESNLGGNSIEIVEKSESEFEVVALDDFLQEKGINAIKVDVEGMEYEVIKGASNLIKQYLPNLYIECQELESYERVSNYLEGFGYLTTKTFNATPTHLFIHESKLTLDQKLEIALHQATKNDYRLAQEISSLKIKLNDANLKYRQATQNIDTYKTRLSELEAQKTQFNDEYQELLVKHQSSQQQLENLREELNASESLKQDILKDQSEHKTKLVEEITALEQNLIMLESELTRVEEKKLEADTKLKLISKEITELKQNVLKLNESLQSVLQDLGAAESAKKTLSEQLSYVQEKYEQLQVSSKSEVESLNKATNELSTALVEFQTKASLLTEQLSDLKLDRNQVVKEYADYRKKTDGQIKQASKALSEKKVELIKLQSDLNFKSTELEALKKTIADEENTHKAQRDAIKELETRITHLESETIKKDAELFKSTEMLKQLTVINETLEEDVSTLKEEKNQALQNSLAAQSELESLSSELNQAQLKYRSITEQYNELNEFIDSQQTLIEAAQREAEKTKRDASTQQLQNKKVLAKAQSEIEFLRIKKQQAEERLVRTRNYLSFRLGYAILEARKSFTGMLKLPFVIWKLRKEHLSRKKNKATENFKSATNNLLFSAPTLGLPSFQNKQVRQVHPQDLVSEFSQMTDLKVACIMDEFTFTSYEPTATLFQLTPKFWEQELQGFKPDLVFIESAWRGKEDLWGNKVGHCAQEVQDIVAWANKNKVPTIFWNKEDPIHFETFLNTARLFDYVFTTDIDCINRYKAALGHERIYFLPFAAQPQHSNPIEKYERKDAFCFAGAYYVRYPDRTRDLGSFIAELPEYRPVEIYDRNFGKDDPNYQFPKEYQPFIVGTLPFEEIDKAYKGYHYAINLNSIKQSQTMFARRIYELLASNTITVSNFSRGIRLLFGDLVVVSDSGEEVLERVKTISQSPEHLRKHKLAALRKVMLEHTYQDRLAYIISKIQGRAVSSWQPNTVVIAYAKNQDQYLAILNNFERQTLENKTLCVVLSNNALLKLIEENRDEVSGDVKLVTLSQMNNVTMGDWLESVEWIAPMVPDDYYGPNYLMDLVLATRYVESDLITKSTHYVRPESGELKLAWPNRQYKYVQACPIRSSLIRCSLVRDENARDWLKSLYTKEISASVAYQAFAIDEFNYCKNGLSIPNQEVLETVNDLVDLDVGISVDKLLAKAEAIQPAEKQQDQAPVWQAEELSELFKEPKNKKAEVSLQDNALHIKSNLQDGQNEYLYATKDFTLNELGYSKQAEFYLETTPGLNIQLVLLFLDSNKQRISHVIKPANRNQQAEIPIGTEFVRFGIRVYATGEADVKALVLGHRPLIPGEVIGQSETLLLTNHYPSYEDLYRNGFVHTRVLAYKEQGVNVDVYRLRKDQGLSYHEFKNIDVITGSQQALDKLIKNGQYKSILVHFLDADMWEVLKNHIDKINIFVWVHGAEIQPWHRREYNYTNEQDLNKAKQQSDIRMSFWRSLLKEIPENLKLIFVSKYFAEEVMEDIGFRLPESHFEIIHNPIDTEIFTYETKPVEQRTKILSIRPYASRKYANDLSVKAILELSKKPFFNELEFRMIGDGVLFDETLDPIKKFTNVIIERRFLTQIEIAKLHKDYGVFLCPTRMDAQGVSKDEAMSSGLVPISNGVTAIPEFIDEYSGILVPGEDYIGMANGIASLYEDLNLFNELSSGAAQRVRRQTNKTIIIDAEVHLFNGD
jgi:FkbM family methyltransferase